MHELKKKCTSIIIFLFQVCGTYLYRLLVYKHNDLNGKEDAAHPI